MDITRESIVDPRGFLLSFLLASVWSDLQCRMQFFDQSLGIIVLRYLNHRKGALVEWLERLCCSAKSCWNVVSLRLGFATRRLENTLCQPSSIRVPFSNQGRIRQRRRGMGSALHLLCPIYNGTLNPLPLWLLGYGKPLPSI